MNINNGIKILENTYLQVLSERCVGKVKINSYQELEKEILRRLKLKFNENEITEIFTCLGDTKKFEFVSYSEILFGLIKHTKDTFIPATSQIRAELSENLSSQEKQVISKSKEQYFKFWDQYISNKKDQILKNKKIQDTTQNRKFIELDLTYKLYRLIPIYEGKNSLKNDWYSNFSTIAMKCEDVFDKFHKEHLDLLQERYKIRFGKLGNIITTTMSIGLTKELRTKNSIIELLFIS